MIFPFVCAVNSFFGLKIAVLYHQAEVLNNLNTCFCESFGNLIVANAKLKPDRFRASCKNVIDVIRNVFGASKNVYEIDILRDIDKPPIDLSAQNFGDMRVINRDRNNVITLMGHVLRYVKSRLFCTRIGKNPGKTC